MGKIRIVVGVSSLACGCVGWWYRPIADPMEGNEQGPIRKGWMSKNLLSDYADKKWPILFDIASRVTIFCTVTVARSFLVYGGNFKIVLDENYTKFLETVVSREPGQPLITVSNHRSLADDTTIFSSILPYWMNVQPRYLRYSLCAQEFCFNNKFPSVINAYIGLGKVLPIWRGGGINQKLLLDYARLVAAGEWCHIYPEAGIFVGESLGGRKNGRENEIGKLKWGVGKLIAHSPNVPIVIPIFFSGSEAMIKTDPITRKTLSYLPQPGHKVVVRMGKPISFADLIEDHEKVHGSLWKYTANVDKDKARVMTEGSNTNNSSSHTTHVVTSEQAVALVENANFNTLNNNNDSNKDSDNTNMKNNASNNSNNTTITTQPTATSANTAVNFHSHWDSRPEDLVLYSKIARRIEESLSELNDESNRELLLSKQTSSMPVVKSK